LNIPFENYCYVHNRPFEVVAVGEAYVFCCPECRETTVASDVTTVTVGNTGTITTTDSVTGSFFIGKDGVDV